MFTVFRLFILPWLHIRYLAFRWTRTGPFGPDSARYVDPVPPESAHPLKKALYDTHVKQYHEASCSVATVANAVNASRILSGFGEALLTQQDLLNTVRTAHWKERMEPQGHNGRRGLPFPVFVRVLRDALDIYGIRYTCFDVIQASKKQSDARKIRKELKSHLLEFETKGNSLILIHFNQGIYVTEYQIPHISLVGGYNPVTDRVTVLDVDPDQTKPYEISFDRFYQGLSNDYGWGFQLLGFSSGGYVFIRLAA